MKATRLEAFSDGVIAIIITIMVLELKAPHDTAPAALLALLPILLCYALSFVTVAIYWVNHHHLIHLVQRVDAGILWNNLHLLFWLSLMPFVTAYLGENHATPFAVACYGAVSLASGVAFYFLRQAIACHHKHDAKLTALHRVLGRKNLIAVGISVAALPLAWVSVWLALALIALPLAMYFVPDRRVEVHLHE